MEENDTAGNKRLILKMSIIVQWFNKALEFKLSRTFYLVYPQISATVSHQFELPISDENFKVNELKLRS